MIQTHDRKNVHSAAASCLSMLARPCRVVFGWLLRHKFTNVSSTQVTHDERLNAKLGEASSNPLSKSLRSWLDAH
jgi:hypothetical protein